MSDPLQKISSLVATFIEGHVEEAHLPKLQRAFRSLLQQSLRSHSSKDAYLASKLLQNLFAQVEEDPRDNPYRSQRKNQLRKELTTFTEMALQSVTFMPEDTSAGSNFASQARYLTLALLLASIFRHKYSIAGSEFFGSMKIQFFSSIREDETREVLMGRIQLLNRVFGRQDAKRPPARSSVDRGHFLRWWLATHPERLKSVIDRIAILGKIKPQIAIWRLKSLASGPVKSKRVRLAEFAVRFGNSLERAHRRQNFYLKNVAMFGMKLIWFKHKREAQLKVINRFFSNFSEKLKAKGQAVVRLVVEANPKATLCQVLARGGARKARFALATLRFATKRKHFALGYKVVDMISRAMGRQTKQMISHLRDPRTRALEIYQISTRRIFRRYFGQLRGRTTLERTTEANVVHLVERLERISEILRSLAGAEFFQSLFAQQRKATIGLVMLEKAFDIRDNYLRTTELDFYLGKLIEHRNDWLGKALKRFKKRFRKTLADKLRSCFLALKNRNNRIKKSLNFGFEKLVSSSKLQQSSVMEALKTNSSLAKTLRTARSKLNLFSKIFDSSKDKKRDALNRLRKSCANRSQILRGLFRSLSTQNETKKRQVLAKLLAFNRLSSTKSEKATRTISKLVPKTKATLSSALAKLRRFKDTRGSAISMVNRLFRVWNRRCFERPLTALLQHHRTEKAKLEEKSAGNAAKKQAVLQAAVLSSLQSKISTRLALVFTALKSQKSALKFQNFDIFRVARVLAKRNNRQMKEVLFSLRKLNRFGRYGDPRTHLGVEKISRVESAALSRKREAISAMRTWGVKQKTIERLLASMKFRGAGNRIQQAFAKLRGFAMLRVLKAKTAMLKVYTAQRRKKAMVFTELRGFLRKFGDIEGLRSGKRKVEEKSMVMIQRTGGNKVREALRNLRNFAAQKREEEQKLAKQAKFFIIFRRLEEASRSKTKFLARNLIRSDRQKLSAVKKLHSAADSKLYLVWSSLINNSLAEAGRQERKARLRRLAARGLSAWAATAARGCLARLRRFAANKTSPPLSSETPTLRKRSQAATLVPLILTRLVTERQRLGFNHLRARLPFPRRLAAPLTALCDLGQHWRRMALFFGFVRIRTAFDLPHKLGQFRSLVGAQRLLQATAAAVDPPRSEAAAFAALRRFGRPVSRFKAALAAALRRAENEMASYEPKDQTRLAASSIIELLRAKAGELAAEATKAGQKSAEIARDLSSLDSARAETAGSLAGIEQSSHRIRMRLESANEAAQLVDALRAAAKEASSTAEGLRARIVDAEARPPVLTGEVAELTATLASETRRLAGLREELASLEARDGEMATLRGAAEARRLEAVAAATAATTSGSSSNFWRPFGRTRPSLGEINPSTSQLSAEDTAREVAALDRQLSTYKILKRRQKEEIGRVEFSLTAGRERLERLKAERGLQGSVEETEDIVVLRRLYDTAQLKADQLNVELNEQLAQFQRTAEDLNTSLAGSEHITSEPSFPQSQLEAQLLADARVASELRQRLGDFDRRAAPLRVEFDRLAQRRFALLAELFNVRTELTRLLGGSDEPRPRLESVRLTKSGDLSIPKPHFQRQTLLAPAMSSQELPDTGSLHDVNLSLHWPSETPAGSERGDQATHFLKFSQSGRNRRARLRIFTNYLLSNGRFEENDFSGPPVVRSVETRHLRLNTYFPSGTPKSVIDLAGSVKTTPVSVNTEPALSPLPHPFANIISTDQNGHLPPPSEALTRRVAAGAALLCAIESFIQRRKLQALKRVSAVVYADKYKDYLVKFLPVVTRSSDRLAAAARAVLGRWRLAREINPWLAKFPRRLVATTPIDLQISLWRLRAVRRRAAAPSDLDSRGLLPAALRRTALRAALRAVASATINSNKNFLRPTTSAARVLEARLRRSTLLVIAAGFAALKVAAVAADERFFSFDADPASRRVSMGPTFLQVVTGENNHLRQMLLDKEELLKEKEMENERLLKDFDLLKNSHFCSYTRPVEKVFQRHRKRLLLAAMELIALDAA